MAEKQHTANDWLRNAIVQAVNETDSVKSLRIIYTFVKSFLKH